MKQILRNLGYNIADMVHNYANLMGDSVNEASVVLEAYKLRNQLLSDSQFMIYNQSNKAKIEFRDKHYSPLELLKGIETHQIPARFFDRYRQDIMQGYQRNQVLASSFNKKAL